MFLYKILAYTIHGKIEKSHTKKINLKYPDQHGTKTLNYQMDHNLYQILKTILSISPKNLKH